MKERPEIYQRQLYFKGKGTFNLIDQAEAIAIRENISFNQLNRQALEEYVQRHGAGNSCFTLDKYGVTWTKATSVTKCSFKDCNTVATGIGLRTDSNQTIGFCTRHFLLVKEQKCYKPDGTPLYTNLKWIDTSQKHITTEASV